MNMTPQQLKAFVKEPDSKKTMAMILAFKRVMEARDSLADVKEITDRTEGRAFQNVDITTNGKDFGLSGDQAEQLIRARANRSDS